MNIQEFKVRKIYDIRKDELGPEEVFEVFSPKMNQVIGWVVIDNTYRSSQRIGKGGTAMYPGCSLDVTLRKARVMSMKQVFCSPIGKSFRYPPWGGAKGGISWDSGSSDAEMVLRGWARALYDAKVIPCRYIFGLDVGLSEWAARAVIEELGDRKASTGKPQDMGGVPYDELGLTGYGLLIAAEKMMRRKYLDISSPKASVAIQGFGAVGSGFMRWLSELYPNGARVVAVSDKNGAIFSTWGLSYHQCEKILSKPVDENNLPEDVSKIDLGSELYLPVDCLVLAYKEDQVTMKNVRNIKAQIVVEGANRGIANDAEKFLWKNNILSLTDFVVNCGASASVYVEYADGSIDEAIAYVREVVGGNTQMIFEKMDENKNLSPREIAEKIAVLEIKKCMK